MKLFSLPSELPFADTLARGLRERAKAEAGKDPAALADYVILLPNRRACRSLREAFLRQSDGAPLLLPRMLALGDTDEEELLLSDPLGLPGEAQGGLPEALDDYDRLFVLMRLVGQWRKRVEGETAQGGEAQNLRLAKELARLLDQVETEGLDFADLESLVPQDFSEHWQKTLEFLAIITEAWPAIEKERGAVSAAKRRRYLLEWQADAWRRSPPGFPVIAAGSTGSIPATAGLLAVVAGLPKGEVILPGLDLEADEDAWEAAAEDPGHPQFGMAKLLADMGVPRKEVRPWREHEEEGAARSRREAVAEALRPAALTARWSEKKLRFPEAELEVAFSGVRRVDCQSRQEEALVIALALRQVLEIDGKTGALVTTDRALAERVAAELGRWGIEIDDSAGEPLAETAVGGYLRLTARLLSEGPSALNLLAALKHPKTRGGEPDGDFRLALRDFERLVLRGPAPKADLGSLRALLKEARSDARSERDKAAFERLEPWFDRLEALLGPALADFAATQPLSELLERHLRFAETLAATDSQDGKELLWRKEDGDAAAKLLRRVLGAAGEHPPLRVRDYADLFDGLLHGVSVRRPYALHPRLFIWGAMEARLQRADLMILGSLNEGSWPAESDPGPWMSRPMRAQFGLPSPERAIGLSAHDFAQALGAREVMLTRANRVEGSPTVPARWLYRLDAFLKAVGAPTDLLTRDAEAWLHWAESLDTPEGEAQPCAPPLPCPPAEARPREASVTDVERLQRDPYAFYAKNVLKLRALEELEADVGAKERGIDIHAVLEAFCKAYPEALPPEAKQTLDGLFDDLRTKMESRPSLAALWGPRLARIADWVWEQEQARRGAIAGAVTKVHAECWGRMALPGAGGFELFGKADRLEALAEGGYRVMDYKTGGLPAKKEVEDGRAPQLVLEAAMLRAGGFKDLPPGDVATLVYWKLTGGRKPGEERVIAVSEAEIEDQVERLAALISHYSDPASPYRARPRPAHALRYNDYAHLARIREWAGDEEEGWSP